MAKQKILIVEDEGIAALHIRKTLGNLGYGALSYNMLSQEIER